MLHDDGLTIESLEFVSRLSRALDRMTSLTREPGTGFTTQSICAVSMNHQIAPKSCVTSSTLHEAVQPHGRKAEYEEETTHVRDGR